MSTRVTNVKDVDAEVWIKAFAAHLKSTGKITIPKWSTLAKTATFKEHGPYDDDWLYTRMAAILRRVYIHKGVGMATFKRIFGGRERRGCRGQHHAKASGGNIRWSLQQLEKLKFIAECEDGGRRITSQGMRAADTIAAQCRA